MVDRVLVTNLANLAGHDANKKTGAECHAGRKSPVSIS
jgi:hypothetical protein